MGGKRVSMTDGIQALHSDMNLRLNIAIGLQTAMLVVGVTLLVASASLLL